MRTSRALTVSGGGGAWCIPEGIFWGEKKLKKKMKKKEKKIWRLPLKIGNTPPPRKIGDPPHPPPKKFGDPSKIWRPPGLDPPLENLKTPRDQTHSTPTPHPWTEFLTHASQNITLAQLRCGR